MASSRSPVNFARSFVVIDVSSAFFLNSSLITFGYSSSDRELMNSVRFLYLALSPPIMPVMFPSSSTPPSSKYVTPLISSYSSSSSSAATVMRPSAGLDGLIAAILSFPFVFFSFFVSVMVFFGE